MPGFEWLGEEERRAVDEVMARGVLFRYEFGDARAGQWKVKEFEEAFARYTGAAHALAVASGTAALKVGLSALGIGPGDEVITQGFTFVATWEAILDTGAEVVFCEVDETLCMDPEDLKRKITPRTRCIVPVHMLGGAARISEIVDIARSRGIAVLEDTAQAVGASVGGKHLGTFGDVGTFSFDSVKTLTTGEGGMVVCAEEEIWRNASEYHDHGHDHRPVGRGNEGRRFIGFNYRMMELQGAIGLEQLKKLPRMLETYRSHHQVLAEAISRVPGAHLREQVDAAGDSCTFISWFMPTEAQARALAMALAEEGAAAVYWGDNTWHTYHNWEHLHAGASVIKSGWPFVRPDGRRLEYAPGALPATEGLLKRCLSWQIMLNWDGQQLEKMVSALEKAAARM